jgi:type I protein arginine methyltransferase
MATHIDADPHHGSYLDVSTHKDMLRDVVRTSAYSEAIRALVQPGSRVIDFGSGTGVLAIFAARCNARRVDAIERTPMVEQAREIAKLSGCPEIVFHRADHQSFRTDGPVDVIVSEWMGHFLFSESMLEPLIALRDRWLKPGGIMLPGRVAMSAALVTDEELYEDGSFLERRPYGIDFGPIADLPLRQSRLVTLDEHQVVPQHCDLGSLDMHSVARTPERLTGTLSVDREATSFGLVAWFDAFLSAHVCFGTGPHQPPTHWRQLYFPFPEPFEVSPGKPLTISITPPPQVENTDPTWAWSISDGDHTLQVDERASFARI